MVNRIFILICLFVASLVCDAQTTIDLNVGYINPSGTISQKPKAPVNPLLRRMFGGFAIHRRMSI